jgi:hypothetical protein
MQTTSLKGRDFTAISDFTREETDSILDTTFELKLERARGVRHLLEDAPAMRRRLRGDRRRHRWSPLRGLRPGREPLARPEGDYCAHDARLT